MSGPTDDESLHMLPPQVAERITDELSDRGGKVLGYIQTAAALIRQAAADEEGLRLAQSAGYNLREALDAVVTAYSPAENLLQTVLAAWERYRADTSAPDTDPAQELETFEDVVKRVAERRQQSYRRDAQLLTYLTARAGVPPVPGDLAPGPECARLLSTANALVHERKLHGPSALEEATALYAGTSAWLVRMFTPSDATVRALSELAREPWSGQQQSYRLRSLVSSPHHLRLFFSVLIDPAWLDALYEAKVIRPPQPGALWPEAALEDGPGRIYPAELAHLLERMLADVKTLPAQGRAEARFMLLRTASQLGRAGHPVVAKVIATSLATTPCGLSRLASTRARTEQPAKAG